MKLFCAGLFHEANASSPIPTTLADFGVSREMQPDGSTWAIPVQDTLEDLLIPAAATSRGHTVVTGLIAAAEPSAPCTAEDFTLLRETIAGQIQKADGIDAIALFLHGAQTAQSHPDCTGEILQRVREVAGPQLPIAVMLDLHANLSPAAIDSADILVCCREYPHIDFPATAAQLVDLLERTVAGRARPVTAFQPVPMLGSFPTTTPPMRRLLADIAEQQAQDGILSISLCHGFPWANTAQTGAGVIVTSDGDAPRAEALARAIGQRFFRLQADITMRGLSIDAAIDHALASASVPTIIADCADNPGGGAPGDATFILRRLIERDVPRAAVGLICDPDAVAAARAAGLGNAVELDIGGRYPPHSGSPVQARATVIGVQAELQQPGLPGLPTEALGPAAAVQFGGITVALISRRTQTLDPAPFRALNVDLERMQLLVIKSSEHFRARFAAISDDIVHCHAPGAQSFDFSLLADGPVRRPITPLDTPPFSRDGCLWRLEAQAEH